MDVSVIGRVENTKLPFRQCLRPLFEAIINSIHSIEDHGRQDGRISITVLRNPQVDLKVDGEEVKTYQDIIGFKISDNGSGFNQDNFHSFTRADSRWKASRGGRGVGRFLWLKAFDVAKIESTFQDHEQWQRRSFKFMLSEEGIEKHSLENVEKGPYETTVSLLGFNPSYQAYAPKQLSTIAHRIVEHCLEYFVLELAPTILLRDDDAEDLINLHEIYGDLVATSNQVNLDVGKHKFKMIHFMLHAQGGLEHKVSYCANHRVAQDEKLSSSKIPDLLTPVASLDSDDEFIYNGYVSGVYLDSHVNQERTGFNNLVEVGGIEFEEELPWLIIEDAALSAAKEYLDPYVQEVREAKEVHIANYVTKQAPEYRILLKHRPADLDRIPPGLSDDKLDRHLYEIQRHWEIELKHKAEDLLSNGMETEDNASEIAIRTKYEDFLGEWNDLGKANLAKYIVHRKATLEILGQRLKRSQSGKYSLEDAIHDIVFPLKTTSDDIAFDQQNLWIIDEKLAYHKYLASEISLRKVDVTTSNQLDRPDILIFDHPIAVVSDDAPFSSVVIFEFKRPMRDDYRDGDSKNPIQQVYKYVDYLKSEDAVDKDGRPVGKLDSVPFYCYVVADLTKTLREQANYAGLESTPDGEGYFGYNKQIGTYIEIISFNKLLYDAEKRNKVLFDKLNISTPFPSER